jgi:nucleotide-binding universal stress UspA family protein
MNRSRQEGYAGDLARQVKEAVPKTPVIVAGRIIGPAPAEKMLRDGHADLVGLARTLFADPLWPHKVEDGEEESILFCKGCNTCLLKVINDEPVVCVRWDKVKTTGLKLALTNKREKWKKILIAMDDTESSLESVEYAGHMIGPGKKITLFSIVNEQQGKDDGRAMREERNVLLAQAKCLLQNAGINEKDIRTKVVKMQKGIEQDLLRELQRGEYGSVILGRRGVSRTRQVLFGSISNYIVHHAKGCGVWVID